VKGWKTKKQAGGLAFLLSTRSYGDSSTKEIIPASSTDKRKSQSASSGFFDFGAKPGLLEGRR